MRYFGEPKIPDGVDSSVIMKVYREEIERYGPEVIQAAAEHLIKTRKHRNFPLAEECRRACVEAQNAIAERKLAEKPRKMSSDPWSMDRIRQANQMMDSTIGRLAAEEGWIIHLHDWCRENGRLPNPMEGEKVRSKGLAIKAERDRIDAMPGANMRIVKAVGSAMQRKREKLGKMAFATVA